MKKIFKNAKFKNPYFWIALVGLIFAAAGVDFNTLTSWKLLGDAIFGILSNPVSIVAVITTIVGIWNDNSTNGLDKIQNKEGEK